MTASNFRFVLADAALITDLAWQVHREVQNVKRLLSVGSIDRNCIVTDSGINPLEFTSRIGYPTIAGQEGSSSRRTAVLRGARDGRMATVTDSRRGALWSPRSKTGLRTSRSAWRSFGRRQAIHTCGDRNRAGGQTAVRVSTFGPDTRISYLLEQLSH